MPPADPAPLADRLRADRTHGAAELARQALAMLRDYARAGHADESGILHCAEALRDARPSMGAVGRIVQHWINTLPHGDAGIAQRAVVHCDAVLRLANAARDDTVHIARRRLAGTPGTILTHSASSTVVRVLSEHSPAEIVVTASEPGGEGRALAATLGSRCVEDDEAVTPATLGDPRANAYGALPFASPPRLASPPRRHPT